MDHDHRHVVRERCRIEPADEVALQRGSDEPLDPMDTGQDQQGPSGLPGAERRNIDGELLAIGTPRRDGVRLDRDARRRRGPPEAGPALVVGEGQASETHGAGPYAWSAWDGKVVEVDVAAARDRSLRDETGSNPCKPPGC